MHLFKLGPIPPDVSSQPALYFRTKVAARTFARAHVLFGRGSSPHRKELTLTRVIVTNTSDEFVSLLNGEVPTEYDTDPPQAWTFSPRGGLVAIDPDNLKEEA
jgi:hypothetical protein